MGPTPHFGPVPLVRELRPNFEGGCRVMPENRPPTPCQRPSIVRQTDAEWPASFLIEHKP